jgi:hypothetical protein
MQCVIRYAIWVLTVMLAANAAAQTYPLKIIRLVAPMSRQSTSTRLVCSKC